MASADEAPGLEDVEVVTKYKLAAEMANRVLKAVIEATKPGVSVLSLCTLGDELILKETATAYNKKTDGKTISKGIGFPTCVSLNHIVCHNSPLASDPEEIVQEGDVVKIDLGVQLGGYMAPVAATIVAGATLAAPVTGRKADVILAAYYAAEAAMRLCKVGGKSEAITDAINKVAKAYNCTAVEGMLMHRIEHDNIAGEKAIIQNPSDAQKKDHKECVFAVNEVYAIDVLVSTGEGKPRQSDLKTSVFKKTQIVFQLRMKTSRAVLSEITTKFSVFPFAVRSCEDEKKTLLGVSECVKHQVLEAYDRLTERPGEVVAQFKALVLLMPNGTLKVTSSPFDPAMYKSELSLQDPELSALLKTSLTAKAKKKKKKAAAAGAGDKKADDAAAEDDGEEES